MPEVYLDLKDLWKLSQVQFVTESQLHVVHTTTYVESVFDPPGYLPGRVFGKRYSEHHYKNRMFQNWVSGRSQYLGEPYQPRPSYKPVHTMMDMVKLNTLRWVFELRKQFEYNARFYLESYIVRILHYCVCWRCIACCLHLLEPYHTIYFLTTVYNYICLRSNYVCNYLHIEITTSKHISNLW